MRITLPEPKRFSKLFKNVTNISFTKTVTGICTDSRQCVEGDLYIAIPLMVISLSKMHKALEQLQH